MRKKIKKKPLMLDNKKSMEQINGKIITQKKTEEKKKIESYKG